MERPPTDDYEAISIYNTQHVDNWPLCGIPVGTLLTVAMPYGQEALAEVLWLIYTRGTQRVEAIRVRWLPATTQTIRGYTLIWGKKVESLIEGTLPYPPDPNEIMYGMPQMGVYRLYTRAETCSENSSHFGKIARGASV